jgi:hypothetical protein
MSGHNAEHRRRTGTGADADKYPHFFVAFAAGSSG